MLRTTKSCRYLGSPGLDTAGAGREGVLRAHLVEFVGFGERLADVQVRKAGGFAQGVVDVAGHRLRPD